MAARSSSKAFGKVNILLLTFIYASMCYSENAEEGRSKAHSVAEHGVNKDESSLTLFQLFVLGIEINCSPFLKETSQTQ